MLSKVITHLKVAYNLPFCRYTSKATVQPLRKKKPKSTIEKHNHFVDYRNVTLVAGNGGDGCISFLHLWKNAMAGPSGGDGGNGGHVILHANTRIKSLADVPSVVRAQHGQSGRGKNLAGKNGEDYVLEVPIGTFVMEGEEVLASLNAHGDEFIAARGGAGGHGNHFYLSNENRHPEIAEYGGIGETKKYILEMKIMAHVGLVGFPNAGKSTLLRAISRARPKVAAYPFTTMNPHVGIVHYADYVQLAVADLPGLIPDAHKNRGLGISFLKHIERCVCILYVIDLSSESPWGQLVSLQYELEQYKKDLSKRPCAIVANKVDIAQSEENLEVLKQNVNLPIYPISAKCGTNIKSLLDYIRQMYDKHNKDTLIW